MRELLVFGEKTFKIEIPDDAKITFGPWSPPGMRENQGGMYGGPSKAVGTLRIYQGSKENIVALFAGVMGFRDLTLKYAEEIAKEEGATIWKDDQEGYIRESKVRRSKEWIAPLAEIEEAELDELAEFEPEPEPPKRTRKKAT